MDFGTPLYGQDHPASDYFVDYHNAMEPDSYGQKPDSSEDLGLGIKDIGMSVPMGIAAQNVAGIYSKIRMGAGNIEIQFPGYRSGSRNAQTPELFGEDQRQAIRELSMANEVDFTTHASFSMMGMMRDPSGQQAYPVSAGVNNLRELKTAIDFQADVGGGGSVVMHSGEFDRPLTDMNLDDEGGRVNLARDASGRLMFQETHTQEKAAAFQLLDDRTGQIMPVQKDRLVSTPVWNRATHSYKGKDTEGREVHIEKGDYVNYDGEKIANEYTYDPVKGRVPVFNPHKQEFGTQMVTFDHFRKEAEEYNKWLKGDLARKGIDWRQDPDWYYKKRYPEEAYALVQQDAQEAGSRGWAVSMASNSKRVMEELENLQKAREYYLKLDQSLPESEKWRMMQQIPTSRIPGIPAKTENILKTIDEQIFEAKKNLEYTRGSGAQYEQSANEIAENKRHMIAPIKRLEKHGVRMYAEAGIHAMRRSRDPSNPVVVAIEHIFPESFGGHPEELKWVIKKSRQRMVDMLTKPKIEGGVSWKPTELTKKKLHEGMMQDNPFYMGMSRDEAEKVAEKHLKATIDTGHINMWRKYWQEDPRKTAEQNDAAFNNWAVKAIETLAKEKMIGNVHLADNYGYHDDHLSPGQGNSPVKPIMQVIKKYGYDKAVTVEPGADASTDASDFHGLMKTWRFFGSSVYGMGGGGGGGRAGGTWGDVQYSYFGQGKPPYYIFGGYAPSNDWQLWSQVPLE